MTSRCVGFGPFELQLDSATLKRGGRIVKLAPQPAKLLVLLVERGGEVVTREEIQASLWPDGTFVDFDQSINFCVKRIREALADDPASPRYIETVPKRGYRFLGELRDASLPSVRSGWPRWILAGTVALAALTLFLIARNDSPRTPGSPVHLSITLEPGQDLWGVRPVVISPDSRHIVFTSSGELFLREIGSPEARPIRGTERAQNPFFAPDGEHIGFLKDGSIQTASILGGASSPLVAVDNYIVGDWGDDGSIVYSVASNGPVFRISEGEGAPEKLTTVDVEGGETGHGWPFLLPGSRVLLFTVYREKAPSQIAIKDLETGERQLLVEDGLHAVYAATGHLVFSRGSSLFAVAFDPGNLQTRNPPQLVMAGVRSRRRVSNYDLSRDGTLVYVPADNPGFPASELVWVDRKGRAELVTWQRLPFVAPRLSNDGNRLAVTVASEGFVQFILDVKSGSLVRYRLDGDAHAGHWSPDDKQIAFVLPGPRRLFLGHADGTGEVEQLTFPTTWDLPNSWCANGWLAFSRGATETRRDVYLLSPNGERDPVRILDSKYAELAPALSPDCKWMAYVSDETGEWEVYVASLPDVTVKRQVSRRGGHSPLWSRDGSELFYLEDDGMMVVDVATAPRLELSPPRELFRGRYEIGDGAWTNYDIAPEGERFVMIRAAEDTGSRRIHVVLNWHEELERMDRDGR